MKFSASERRGQRADHVQINAPDKHGVRAELRRLDFQRLQIRQDQPVNPVSGRERGIASQTEIGGGSLHGNRQNQQCQRHGDVEATFPARGFIRQFTQSRSHKDSSSMTRILSFVLNIYCRARKINLPVL